MQAIESYYGKDIETTHQVLYEGAGDEDNSVKQSNTIFLLNKVRLCNEILQLLHFCHNAEKWIPQPLTANSNRMPQ